MKRALIANGIFSATSGIALIAFRTSLAALFGVGTPLLFACIGAGLIVFSITVLVEATRTRRWWVRTIIVQDALWVVASAALLIADPFGITGLGRSIIGTVAFIVLGFAGWQMHALSRMPRA